MISFDHVESYVGDFLDDLRGRGLAGNIVQDSPAQLTEGENALWTGQQYQLAFAGTRDTYHLELRRIEGGIWTPERIEVNPELFNLLVMDFVVKEG